jgi:hypothetical protein
MAVASLMKDETEEMQQLFTSRLNALGIDKMKELAFLLGNELDAEKTSQEIFGDDHCSEVQCSLLKLWNSAKGPGKAVLSWETRQTRSPVLAARSPQAL